MSRRTLSILAGTAAVVLSIAALAAPSALPGDRGRPGDGVPAAPQANPPPQQPRPPRPQGAWPGDRSGHEGCYGDCRRGCSQYPLGLAVVNSEGVATLIYVPDRSTAWHGYGAARKAYTTVTFKAPTSQLIKTVQQDAAIAAKVRADPNLQLQSGGVPLKVGDETIGAIRVSGAEPGGHDEECALIGSIRLKIS